MVGRCADHEVELVSINSDMDFIILIGQILDEFVKINRNLEQINSKLGYIEEQLGDIAN